MGLSAKQRLRAERFNERIEKRSSKKSGKEDEGFKVSALVMGLFIFLVIGSALFQIINSFSRGDTAF